MKGTICYLYLITCPALPTIAGLLGYFFSFRLLRNSKNLDFAKRNVTFIIFSIVATRLGILAAIAKLCLLER